MPARYAVLCGSAPEEFRQKKLIAMHDYLVSAPGGSWQEREIAVFPNGVHELLLECVLNGVLDSEPEEALLYICTESPVPDGDMTFRLGSGEIRKEVLAYYAAARARLRIIYDSCRDFVREEALGYERGERVALEQHRTQHE